MYIPRAQQSGFTLVEIAIVLVIIGLMLGGVLKGQEMIENAKIKNIRNDFEGVAAAFYAYKDRYRVAPGDDTAAAGRWTTPTAAIAGNGDGVVGAANDWVACAANTASEVCTFWDHLRRAGLINGTASADPQNAYGGAIRISQSTGATTGIAAGFNICMGNIAAKAAEALDSAFDDGVPNTGRVRGVLAANNGSPYAAAAAAYADNGTNQYTVCKVL